MTYAFTCSCYSQLTLRVGSFPPLTCDTTCYICDVCFKPLITSTGASCTKKNALSSALIMIALKVHFTHLHDRMQPNMGTSVQIPRSNLPSAVKNDQPSKSFLSAAIRSYLKIWCLSQNYFFIFEILANWPNSKLKKKWLL